MEGVTCKKEGRERCKGGKEEEREGRGGGGKGRKE